MTHLLVRGISFSLTAWIWYIMLVCFFLSLFLLEVWPLCGLWTCQHPNWNYTIDFPGSPTCQLPLYSLKLTSFQNHMSGFFTINLFLYIYTFYWVLFWRLQSIQCLNHYYLNIFWIIKGDICGLTYSKSKSVLNT